MCICAAGRTLTAVGKVTASDCEVDVPIIENSGVRHDDKHTAVLNRQTAIVSAVTAVVTFGGTLLGQQAPGWVDALARDPQAVIVSPAEGAVPPSFRLVGTHTQIDPGTAVWALSRRHDDGRYYAQDRPCALLTESTFDCGTFYLGNQEGGDVDATFDLLIVVATPEVANDLLRAGVKSEPMSELPEGASLLAVKQVSRQ